MSFEPVAITGDGRIGLCEPHIAGNEWTYIKECLDSGWVSSAGNFVERFERGIADYLGSAVEAVAVVNGTSALHTSLMIAGICQSHEVLMPALTFIAPANAVRYCGAWPVFLDVDRETWQLDPNTLSRFVSEECISRDGELINRFTGRRIKAVLPVDLLGHPVDIDPIIETARQHGLVVIEDATESLGAKYKGRPVGTLGDISCLSFNGNKLITTGGGGMIITKSPELALRARYLTTQAKDDPLEYIHGEVGFNYRLTNLQAAMGCAQLEQIDTFIKAKHAITARYNGAFSDLPGITPMPQAEWAQSVFWLYTVLVDEKQYGMNSRELMAKLGQAGVQTRPLWQPLHQSPALADCQGYQIVAAEEIGRNALSLPCSVGLLKEEQERVIQVIKEQMIGF
jgi:perosamine synthetase